MRSKAAILIFTRSVCEEAEKKNLLNQGSKKVNELLISAFHKQTLATVKESGLPYFIIDSEQQKGELFGQRLGNAFISVFNKGFENVIAIGNDSPQLRAHDLLRANSELQNNNCVIGPSYDGGVYLIGINVSDFQLQNFVDLSWETASLGIGLLQYLNNVSSCVVVLKKYQDIDFKEDFAFINLLKTLPAGFTSILKSILAYLKIIYYGYKNKGPISDAFRNISLRGPPSIVFN